MHSANELFSEVDVDDSGTLVGEEIEALAAWVWTSLHPGETLTPEIRRVEAARADVKLGAGAKTRAAVPSRRESNKV